MTEPQATAAAGATSGALAALLEALALDYAAILWGLAGGLIRIYVNGLIIWEEPCITSATGTKCGLQANAGANTYFKNFTILSSAQ